MNSTALLLGGLGLQKKAARMVEIEKQILGICACTGLSPDEVAVKTKGQYLDLILKAAAVTGECMSAEDAQHLTTVAAILSVETGRRMSASQFLP